MKKKFTKNLDEFKKDIGEILKKEKQAFKIDED